MCFSLSLNASISLFVLGIIVLLRTWFTFEADTPIRCFSSRQWAGESPARLAGTDQPCLALTAISLQNKLNQQVKIFSISFFTTSQDVIYSLSLGVGLGLNTNDMGMSRRPAQVAALKE